MSEFSNKLRHSGGDARVGTVQWLGRKLRNHNPFAELVGSLPKHARLRAGLTNTKHGLVMLRERTVEQEFPSIIYSLADSRRFEFSIREVEPNEDLGELQAVGW